ncbi:MAG: M48 family metalloprotease [Pseudomonadota bacterium]
MISKRLQRAVLSAALTAMVMLSGQSSAFELNLNALSDLVKNVDTAVSGISEEKEIKLGKEVAASLLGAMPLVDNDELQKYLNTVGVWVAQQSKRNNLDWRFALVDDAGVNAFAAPGGYIFVTRGLFSILNSEAELAGVLGHEIAHVVRKHHLDAMQSAAQRQVAGDLLLTLADSDDREAMNALVSAGTKIYARGLDREDEIEADRIGVVYATRAGYHPFSLLDVLTTIDSMAKDSEHLAFFTATHPPTGERINILDQLMGSHFDTYADQPVVRERFVTAREKLLAMYSAE